MQTEEEIIREFMKLAMELIGPGSDYFPTVVRVKKEFGFHDMTPIKQVEMLWRVKECIEDLYRKNPRTKAQGSSSQST